MYEIMSPQLWGPVMMASGTKTDAFYVVLLESFFRIILLRKMKSTETPYIAAVLRGLHTVVM